MIDIIISRLIVFSYSSGGRIVGDSPRYEIRQGDYKTFSKLLFFKQAVTDHYTTSYLEGIRGVLKNYPDV